jgi:hypothetical protein
MLASNLHFTRLKSPIKPCESRRGYGLRFLVGRRFGRGAVCVPFELAHHLSSAPELTASLLHLKLIRSGPQNHRQSRQTDLPPISATNLFCGPMLLSVVLGATPVNISTVLAPPVPASLTFKFQSHYRGEHPRIIQTPEIQSRSVPCSLLNISYTFSWGIDCCDGGRGPFGWTGKHADDGRGQNLL